MLNITYLLKYTQKILNAYIFAEYIKNLIIHRGIWTTYMQVG